MARSDFNKVEKQPYWNHTSAWVLSCEFADFSQEHLWVTTFVYYWYYQLFFFSQTQFKGTVCILNGNLNKERRLVFSRFLDLHGR